MRDERGSMVVEAALALPIFMFAIITILSITNICSAQALMANSINGIAKDMGKYSYIYCKVGGNSANQNLEGKGSSAKEATASIMDATTLKSLIDSTGDLVYQASTDSEMAESIFYMIGNDIKNEAANTIADSICEKVLEDRLTSEGYTADSILRHYGIEEGLSGLDFSNSDILGSNEPGVITIVVEYDVKVIDLLGIDYKFHFVQSAKANMWDPTGTEGSGDSGDSGEGGSGEESDDSSTEATTETTEESTTEESSTETTTEAGDSSDTDDITAKLDTIRNQYGSEVDRIYKDYGNEAVELIYLYGDGAYYSIAHKGGDAVRLISKYGQGAANCIYSNEDKFVEISALIDEYGQDAVDVISEYGYTSDQAVIDKINGK